MYALMSTVNTRQKSSSSTKWRFDLGRDTTRLDPARSTPSAHASRGVLIPEFPK